MAKTKIKETVSKQTGFDFGNLYGFDNKKNPNERDFLASIVVGEKGQGKTSFMEWYILKYQTETNNLFAQGKIKKQRPILIWDSVDAFKTYPEITIEELKYGAIIPNSDPPMARKWTKGVRRLVRRWHDPKDDEKALMTISACFRDGLLVGDEIHEWLDPTNPKAWQQDMVKKHRNYGNDVLLGTQNLMDIPIGLRPHFWRYVFFKTPEFVGGVSWLEVRRFPQPQRFYEAWKTAQAYDEIDDSRMQPYSVFEKNHAALKF